MTSKTIKGDNSSRTYNPLEFPPLPATSRARDLGIILDVSRRRLALRPEHQQQSYNQKFKRNKISVEVNEKRKNTIQDSGYDKKTLEQCLIGSYGFTDYQPSSILTKRSKCMEQKTNKEANSPNQKNVQEGLLESLKKTLEIWPHKQENNPIENLIEQLIAQIQYVEEEDSSSEEC
ncbi:hypothetical protein WA026_009309 [Henosepilachna vigintioctopunctata]|uniref:Uncharacterized protein n=1 Tax=Henosepilachna vigintioctopunctata TaxID=420089 RepID=A0AAW1URC8_9CUCU